MSYSPIVFHRAKRVSNKVHNHKGIKYTLWKCIITGLLFWHPRKIDKKFYSDDPFLFQKQSHWESLDPAPWTQFVFDKDFPVSFSSNKTVLDVGCGNGAFLGKLAIKKLENFGIDLDPNAVFAARKRLGIGFNILNLTLSELTSAHQYHNRFDVITIFEVLEHQEKPNDFLKQLKILLKDDGYIVGSTPNSDRITTRLGLREPFDYPPNHFIWFDIKGLKNFFSYNSLEIIHLCPAIQKLKVENVRYSILSGLFGKRYLSLTKNISSYFNVNKTKVNQVESINRNGIKKLLKYLFTFPFFIFLPLLNVYNSRRATTLHLGFVAKKK